MSASQYLEDEDAKDSGPGRRQWISFWSLMGLQAQNAFNDKALQFTLVPLGAWVAAKAGAEWGTFLPHVLGMLILVPFILFAPVAGWASDTFSKTRVIRLTAWMQLAVFLVVLYSFRMEFLPLAVACFFFLAVQSTILSPAKNGIIKELLGSSRLGFASGIMQMFTILAILVGQILIGIWFSARLETTGSGWTAGLLQMILVCLGAVVTLVMAYSIQVVPAASRKRFHLTLAISHFQQLGQLLGSRPLRLSALGIAYFWAFGAVVQFITLQIAAELYPDGHPNFGRATSYMMLAASGGIGVGSILGALINKRHIELGLNPLGGIIMTVSSVLIIVATPESWFFYTVLAFAGLGAAFFFVPINAFLQDECDPDQRGNILAGSALLNCLAMAGAVILQYVMQEVLNLTPTNQFLILALVSVVATCYVMRLLPRAFVKMLAFSALRAFYRIETIHPERMPEKGGVLLTPNHVSYLDALILTAASPRPVRFLMVSDYFEKPVVGKVAKLFDTVPISSKRAKDAIQVAAAAVKEGSVVCIFPEGELSRSGFMGEFKRGMELIARKADCLIQPVYLDGLWKSIFSAERGKFFWKKPRAIPFGVRVAFGEAWPAKEYRAGDVRRELNFLAGEVFARRHESAGTVKDFLRQRRPDHRALRWVDGVQVCSCTWGEVLELLEQREDLPASAQGHPGAEQWLEDWRALDGLDEEEWRGLLLNAHQLADPYNLGDGKAAVTIDSSLPQAVRRVWGLLLPVITRVEVVVLGPNDGASELGLVARDKVPLRDLVGTVRMREVHRIARAAGVPLTLYLFGEGPQSGNDAEKEIFVGHESAGRVFSFSMPPDPVIHKGDVAHPGWMESSYGRLLPGFVVRSTGEGVELSGKMLPETIDFPGWSVDERGFFSQSDQGESI